MRSNSTCQKECGKVEQANIRIMAEAHCIDRFVRFRRDNLNNSEEFNIVHSH